MWGYSYAQILQNRAIGEQGPSVLRELELRSDYQLMLAVVTSLSGCKLIGHMQSVYGKVTLMCTFFVDCM